MKKVFSTLLCLSIFYLSSQAQLGKCNGKYLGNIIAYSTPSNYSSLWNQVTSENGSKWGSVEGTKGTYNFSNSDLAYNWAKNNGGLFKYHNLMWGAQTPSWVSSASSAELQVSIENYTKAVANHYASMGGLSLIDVLNEPVNTAIASNLKAALTAGYQADPANANDKNNTYGWAIWPFQLARKYFPNATLLINEYNIEFNWNNCRATYIAMSNAIKNAPNLTDGKKNLIDGIGLQAHGMNGASNNLSAANFKACLDEIWTKTGLPIHMTELDIVADPNEAAQKTKFQEFFTIAWEHPHVAGITLWGYIQGSTWIPGNGVAGSGGTDTGLQYAGLTDRPAMTWLKSYMAAQTSLACCPAPAPFGSCTTTCSTPAPTVPAANITYKMGATASQLTATGTSLKWYTDGTGGTALSAAPTPSTAVVGTTTYYVGQTLNGCEGTRASVAVKVYQPQGPYSGTPAPIPGTIQFENFDLGGQDSAYYDSSPGSAVTPVVNFRTTEDVDIENCTDVGAGYNLGYTIAGEWLEYTVNVASTGAYNIAFRVACNGDARTLSLQTNGVTIVNNLAIPNTADWQTWSDVTVNNIQLTAGVQVLRLTIGATDYINLNYMTFTSVASVIPTVTSPISYCQGATATALTATGTALKWYTVATGGTANTTAPIPSTTAVGSTIYYVSQTVNSIESSRAAITVNITATPTAPTVISPVSYIQNATATALSAIGTSLKWYSVATGGTALASAPIPTTTVSGTVNYYVSQTVNTCESPRATIAVVVGSQTISLKAGWNLIGCPIDGSTDISKALSSIWTNVVTLKNMDAFYDSSLAPALNSLKTVEWGKGYFVKVKTACDLDWIVK